MAELEQSTKTSIDEAVHFSKNSPIKSLLPRDPDWQDWPYWQIMENPNCIAHFIELKFETIDDLKKLLQENPAIPEGLASRFSASGKNREELQEAWVLLSKAHDVDPTATPVIDRKSESPISTSEEDEDIKGAIEEKKEPTAKSDEHQAKSDFKLSASGTKLTLTTQSLGGKDVIAKRLKGTEEWKKEPFYVQLASPKYFAYYLEQKFSSEDAIMGTLHENETIPEELYRKFSIRGENRGQAQDAWDYLKTAYGGGRPFQLELSRKSPYTFDMGSDDANTLFEAKTIITSLDADTLRCHEALPEVLRDKFKGFESKLSNVWNDHRASLGFEGDCRYAWEKIADMNLIELIAADNDLEQDLSLPDPNNILDAICAINQHDISDDTLDHHLEVLNKSRARLNAIRLNGIKTEAASLSHDDPAPIRAWGKEVDEARVEVSRGLSDKTIKTAVHTQGKIGAIHDELKKLLETKKPTGIGKLILHTAKAFGIASAIKSTAKHRGNPATSEELSAQWDNASQVYNYALMSDDQKKQREKVLVRALEDVIREEIEAEEAHICQAEEAGDTIAKYQMLIQQHRTALGRNRTRLISDAKNSKKFTTGADENAIVVRDKSAKLENDIDDRMEALDESIRVCEREVDHYESLEALHTEHKEAWIDTVNHSIESIREFRRIEKQVALTQNIELAGKYGENLGNVGIEKKLQLVSERLREARAQEVGKIGSMKRLMDTNETLALDHKKPIAMIEDHTKKIDAEEMVPA